MSRTYEALSEKQQQDEQKMKTKQELTTTTALPPAAFDGFEDDGSDADDRAGIINCDVTQPENPWQDRDGAPVGGRWLVTGIKEEIVYWSDGLIDRTKTIRKQPGIPLPDVDDLNAETDPHTWQQTEYGPRKPFEHQRIVHLIDSATAARKRFITSTIGGKIAFNELKDNVVSMRKMCGQHVAPVIELKIKPWKVKRGPQRRPYLHIVEWALLASSPASPPVLPLVDHSNRNENADEPPAQHPVFDDEIPTFDEVPEEVPF